MITIHDECKDIKISLQVLDVSSEPTASCKREHAKSLAKSTYREVRAWFRKSESEDITHQLLALFLELLTSASPTLMINHLPIALDQPDFLYQFQ